MKYVRRSVPVEAIQFTFNLPEVIDFLKGGPKPLTSDDIVSHYDNLTVMGLKIYPGDWVIREPSGDFIYCSTKKFQAEYESADDDL
jgi:hypothetical protein